ncbi:MAG: TetR family transcriptional regulator [Pseudolysinimonas sp.]|uniref:TetR/AcrR family transcriptional regulator n=1 Tax=Pseudolysinimonas sp. TaxID=2680009 RepID=UPI003C7182E0
MRSIASDDLTTRARIRDAAIVLFGRDGFAATSVRAVATAAGVSPALVLHHFGSKDELRAACDEFIVDAVMGHNDELGIVADSAATMQKWLADVDQFRPQLDYLARMLTDDGPGADRLFDLLVESTTQMIRGQVAAGIMRETPDLEVTALYLTTYGIVPVILGRQIGRRMGADGMTVDVIRRSTLPILDLYTHGLYTDDRFLVAAREALDRTSGPSSGKGDNDPHQDPDPPAAPAS